MTERKYRIPLKSNNKRIRYLERVTAQLNNELIDSAYSVSERTKLYSNLLSTVRLIHEVVIDSKIEELEHRIMALEGKPVPKRQVEPEDDDNLID